MALPSHVFVRAKMSISREITRSETDIALFLTERILIQCTFNLATQGRPTATYVTQFTWRRLNRPFDVFVFWMAEGSVMRRCITSGLAGAVGRADTTTCIGRCLFVEQWLATIWQVDSFAWIMLMLLTPLGGKWIWSRVDVRSRDVLFVGACNCNRT